MSISNILLAVGLIYFLIVLGILFSIGIGYVISRMKHKHNSFESYLDYLEQTIFGYYIGKIFFNTEQERVKAIDEFDAKSQQFLLWFYLTKDYYLKKSAK